MTTRAHRGPSLPCIARSRCAHGAPAATRSGPARAFRPCPLQGRGRPSADRAPLVRRTYAAGPAPSGVRRVDQAERERGTPWAARPKGQEGAGRWRAPAAACAVALVLTVVPSCWAFLVVARTAAGAGRFVSRILTRAPVTRWDARGARGATNRGRRFDAAGFAAADDISPAERPRRCRTQELFQKSASSRQARQMLASSTLKRREAVLPRARPGGHRTRRDPLALRQSPPPTPSPRRPRRRRARRSAGDLGEQRRSSEPRREALPPSRRPGRLGGDQERGAPARRGGGRSVPTSTEAGARAGRCDTGSQLPAGWSTAPRGG